MVDTISEKIIEDILSADTSILADVLDMNCSDLAQLARQKALKSGKLDLLYLHRDQLLLIELKTVPFSEKIIEQINAYQADVSVLQQQRKLIGGPIQKIILTTSFSDRDVLRCQREEVRLVKYHPKDILSKYFENFRELSYFLKIRAADYGVVRLGLLNPTLQLLAQGKTVRDICEIERKSEKTIRNRLSVASLLGLVSQHKREFFLTDFANSILQKGDSRIDDRFNEDQMKSLSRFVSDNPFYSSITYAILSVVETAFVLSRNAYPVPKDDLAEYFVKCVGKESTWKRPRARHTAAYIFSNYARELGLLSKVEDCFYLTPAGIQAILLLQLNRSIKLIEASK